MCLELNVLPQLEALLIGGRKNMPNEIIKTMTNLADSGQDEFVKNWSELAKLTLYEMGVSNKFINSNNANYILAKVVTDLVEDGNLSNTTNALIATLRTNHPHSEDDNV